MKADTPGSVMRPILHLYYIAVQRYAFLLFIYSVKVLIIQQYKLVFMPAMLTFQLKSL